MEDERLEEKVFIELDTPSSVYGLAVSSTRNVGYVASRHAINCFSCSLLSPFPDFATFFPFGEDSASDFVATTHTEVMSLQKLSLSSYSGSSFLSFVTVSFITFNMIDYFDNFNGSTLLLWIHLLIKVEKFCIYAVI